MNQVQERLVTLRSHELCDNTTVQLIDRILVNLASDPVSYLHWEYRRSLFKTKIQFESATAGPSGLSLEIPLKGTSEIVSLLCQTLCDEISSEGLHTLRLIAAVLLTRLEGKQGLGMQEDPQTRATMRNKLIRVTCCISRELSARGFGMLHDTKMHALLASLFRAAQDTLHLLVKIGCWVIDCKPLTLALAEICVCAEAVQLWCNNLLPLDAYTITSRANFTNDLSGFARASQTTCVTVFRKLATSPSPPANSYTDSPLTTLLACIIEHGSRGLTVHTEQLNFLLLQFFPTNRLDMCDEQLAGWIKAVSDAQELFCETFRYLDVSHKLELMRRFVDLEVKHVSELILHTELDRLLQMLDALKAGTEPAASAGAHLYRVFTSLSLLQGLCLPSGMPWGLPFACTDAKAAEALTLSMEHLLDLGFTCPAIEEIAHRVVYRVSTNSFKLKFAAILVLMRTTRDEHRSGQDLPGIHSIMFEIISNHPESACPKRVAREIWVMLFQLKLTPNMWTALNKKTLLFLLSAMQWLAGQCLGSTSGQHVTISPYHHLDESAIISRISQLERPGAIALLSEIRSQGFAALMPPVRLPSAPTTVALTPACLTHHLPPYYIP